MLFLLVRNNNGIAFLQYIMLFSEKKSSNLDDQGHVSLIRKLRFFAQPQGVVYREGINGYSQMFRVNLSEFFAPRVVSENIIIYE